jgi:hypothetical protein
MTIIIVVVNKPILNDKKKGKLVTYGTDLDLILNNSSNNLINKLQGFGKD